MLCIFYALHYPSLRHHHAFILIKQNQISKRHVVKTNNLQNQCRAITKVMMPISQSLSMFSHLHHTFFFHFIHLFISCSASRFPSPSHIIVQKSMAYVHPRIKLPASKYPRIHTASPLGTSWNIREIYTSWHQSPHG
jgi:hypothetical protein